jgi:competence protein ComEC
MRVRGCSLEAQVLQLGRHGSSTSSGQAFLDAVSPEIAIYSAGEGNPYGHPHDEVVERLTDMEITLYGTGVHGTIVIVTDGVTYRVAMATCAPALQQHSWS